MAPRLEALAEEYVERVVASSPPVDLVEMLAGPLPVAVIGEMVGIGPARHQRFRALVEATVAADPMTGDPEVAGRPGAS